MARRVKRIKSKLTADALRARLRYDPETGLFERLDRRVKKVGCIAHRSSHEPYWRIWVCDEHHYAHRLAWLWMTGKWPPYEIDHRNRNGMDNRWVNLRSVPAAIGMWNQNMNSRNKSGQTGVYRHKGGAWIANIAGRHLGSFKTFESACEARRFAELQFPKEYEPPKNANLQSGRDADARG